MYPIQTVKIQTKRSISYWRRASTTLFTVARFLDISVRYLFTLHPPLNGYPVISNAYDIHKLVEYYPAVGKGQVFPVLQMACDFAYLHHVSRGQLGNTAGKVGTACVGGFCCLCGERFVKIPQTGTLDESASVRRR